MGPSHSLPGTREMWNYRVTSLPWTHHETNHPLTKPPSSLSCEWALRQLPLQRRSWCCLPRTLPNPFGIDLIQGVQRSRAGLLGVLSSHVWADLLCWCKSRLIWAFHVGMMPGMHICIIYVFFFKAVRFQACEEMSCWAGKLSNHQPKQSEGQLLLGDTEFSLVLERSSEQTGEKGPFLRALSGNPCMKLLSSHLKTSVPASGKDVPFHVKRTVVQIRRQWGKFIPTVTSCCIPKRNATYARISTLSLLPVLRGLTAFLWKWGA